MKSKYMLIDVSLDIVCSKRTKKVVTVAKGDKFSFRTQEGNKYGARSKCQVKYKLDPSCSSIKFSCSEFNLANTKANCKAGDKLTINADSETRRYCLTISQLIRLKYNISFCQNSGPEILSTHGVEVQFSSNKKIHATGAVCTVQCNTESESEVGNKH